MDKELYKRAEVFSTCPASAGADSADYLQRVVEAAHWSEEAGCTGILIYSDNTQVEPWHLAQAIITNTERLSPLVAVQPVYMHPYTLAKKIATLAFLYKRRVYLNMIAGGFRNDLLALNDPTPHDQRYARLTEYTTIVKRLLQGETVSFDGEFYKVDKLKLAPQIPEELFPGILVSGSSEAGMEAARALEATAIQYPKPVGEYDGEGAPHDLRTGIRIGVISRPDSEQAWRVAHHRFPTDRKGQLTHKMAMKVSDSQWHRQLSELADDGEASPYWLVPFQNYKTMCPYLVGSYAQVGEELRRYCGIGHSTFILDIPAAREDLVHTGKAFESVLEYRKAG